MRKGIQDSDNFWGERDRNRVGDRYTWDFNSVSNVLCLRKGSEENLVKYYNKIW